MDSFPAANGPFIHPSAAFLRWTISLVAVLVFSLQAYSHDPQARSNIIIILADDVG
jgi:hypothetical protein